VYDRLPSTGHAGDFTDAVGDVFSKPAEFL
jgi:hypothetical protein